MKALRPDCEGIDQSEIEANLRSLPVFLRLGVIKDVVVVGVMTGWPVDGSIERNPKKW